MKYQKFTRPLPSDPHGIYVWSARNTQPQGMCEKAVRFLDKGEKLVVLCSL